MIPEEISEIVPEQKNTVLLDLVELNQTIVIEVRFTRVSCFRHYLARYVINLARDIGGYKNVRFVREDDDSPRGGRRRRSRGWFPSLAPIH